MTYEKNVNRLLNYLSEDTGIPKESLHLIGITPDKLDTALVQITAKHVPLHKAEDLIKAQWKAAAPNPSRPSNEEMALINFERTPTGWKHRITDTEYSDSQLLKMSFLQVEESILTHPLYELHRMLKKKIENEPEL